ncbi:MAG TPA: hypothetical protein DDW52_13210, partial [Planctomycetaceae bacterium]|nr:hypothetical protein [Planctomycetaceae bacterium]
QVLRPKTFRKQARWLRKPAVRKPKQLNSSSLHPTQQYPSLIQTHHLQRIRTRIRRTQPDLLLNPNRQTNLTCRTRT